jgi:hypothetical protein
MTLNVCDVLLIHNSSTNPSTSKKEFSLIGRINRTIDNYIISLIDPSYQKVPSSSPQQSQTTTLPQDPDQFPHTQPSTPSNKQSEASALSSLNRDITVLTGMVETANDSQENHDRSTLNLECATSQEFSLRPNSKFLTTRGMNDAFTKAHLLRERQVSTFRKHRAQFLPKKDLSTVTSEVVQNVLAEWKAKAQKPAPIGVAQIQVLSELSAHAAEQFSQNVWNGDDIEDVLKDQRPVVTEVPYYVAHALSSSATVTSEVVQNLFAEWKAKAQKPAPIDLAQIQVLSELSAHAAEQFSQNVWNWADGVARNPDEFQSQMTTYCMPLAMYRRITFCMKNNNVIYQSDSKAKKNTATPAKTDTPVSERPSESHVETLMRLERKAQAEVQRLGDTRSSYHSFASSPVIKINRPKGFFSGMFRRCLRSR